MTRGVLFRIESVKAYPDDYTETTEVAKKELRENARPELVGLVEDIGSYDVIFLGYPNWWGTIPMPVFTFLEGHNLAGKTIAPSVERRSRLSVRTKEADLAAAKWISRSSARAPHSQKVWEYTGRT